MQVVVIALSSWLQSAAIADEPTPPSASTTSADPTQRVERARKTREWQFEIGFRGRRVSAPRSLFDLWYNDADTPGWPLPNEDRPFVNGYVYGIEWGFKKKQANGFLWVDWMDSNMPAGYWDDNEGDEPPNTTDGDYIRPAHNLGLLAFGGDYAFEVDMVRLDMTNHAFGMSFMVGAGLGVGVMLGSLDEWSEAEDGTPAYVQFAAGDDPDSDKKIPRVYPIVDFNVGLRLNFGDRVVLRLEGGLHTLLYYGAALSYRF